MDARTIYGLMKPYLDTLDISEKRALSKLIIKFPAGTNGCHHRKQISLAAAKENLKEFCRREMEREKRERQQI